jgi:hypothetical protein
MWEGLGSAVIGAVAVVVGVWFAQWLNERSKQAAAKLDAEVALGIAIGDQRDAAVKGRGARRGDYHLWPLRNELFRLRPVLGADSSSYKLAAEFYTAVESLRDWIKHRSPAAAAADEESLDAAFARYAKALDQYAESVRTYLGTPAQLRGTPPEARMPELP